MPFDLAEAKRKALESYLADVPTRALFNCLTYEL